MRRLVTFRIGGSRYGLPAELVCEVTEPGSVKRALPAGAQSCVDLMKVRDRWLPLVEIPGAKRSADDSGAADAVLLVLGRGRGTVCALVDEVGEVIESEADARRGRTEGLMEVDGELVRMLDPEALSSGSGTLFEEGASEMEERRAEAEPRRFVAFRVGGEEFGLDVANVLEVQRMPAVREVPRAPDFVEGVVEVRATVVPVIDMRTRFEIPEDQRGRDERLLISEGEHGPVGLVVDEVSGVVQAAEDAVEAPPDFFKGLAGRYLAGVARTEERMIVLLDLDEILSSQERIDLREMLEEVADRERRDAPGHDRDAKDGQAAKTKATSRGKSKTKTSKSKRSGGKKTSGARKRASRRSKEED